MSNKLVKANLVEGVYADLEGRHSKKTIAEIIDSTLREIKQSVADGNSIILRGFGVFRWFKSKARQAVNIEGEDVVVPEKITMKFKAYDSVFDE